MESTLIRSDLPRNASGRTTPRRPGLRATGFLLLAAIAPPVLPAVDANEWQFEITPYLWAAGLDGNVATGGGTPVSSPVDGDSSFFALENLDLAGFLAFEGHKGPWRILADGLYVAYSDRFSSGPLTTDMEVEGIILEGALGYQVPRYDNLELIAGGRFFSVRNQIDLTPGPAGDQRKEWADPFIGARVRFDINERWQASLRGDIGGFGVSSEHMYNAAAALAYRVNDSTSVKFGYRYLSADFERDLFRFDVALKGFGLGVGVRF